MKEELEKKYIKLIMDVGIEDVSYKQRREILRFFKDYSKDEIVALSMQHYIFLDVELDWLKKRYIKIPRFLTNIKGLAIFDLCIFTILIIVNVSVKNYFAAMFLFILLLLLEVILLNRWSRRSKNGVKIIQKK